MKILVSYEIIECKLFFFILRFDYFVQATFKSRNEFPTLFMSTKCYSDVMHLAFYNLFNILFLRMVGIIILKVKNMSLCHDITSLRIKTHSREVYLTVLYVSKSMCVCVYESIIVKYNSKYTSIILQLKNLCIVKHWASGWNATYAYL